MAHANATEIAMAPLSCAEVACGPAADLGTRPAGRLLLASVQASVKELASQAAAVDDAMTAMAESPEATPGKARRLARNVIPRWHFAMLNDIERNDALATAIEHQVRPGDYVLDIGAGSGLLAMLAARAGAAKVISCEANPLLAEIASQVIATHGLSDVITVVAGSSSQLAVGRELERPADVLLAEIVDCGLIGEGILPTLRHAREHLLAAGARLMPKSARLLGVLVRSKVVDGLNRVTNAAGFDIGLVNSVATAGHFPVRLQTWPHTVLSDAAELLSFDFAAGPLDEDGKRKVCLTTTASGTAHGIAAWFEMELSAGVTLRNSPDNVSSHWMQAWIPFDAPVEVRKGSVLEFDLHWQDGLLFITRPPVTRLIDCGLESLITKNGAE